MLTEASCIFEASIAAVAFMSSLTITPEAIDVAPVLSMLMSPDIATLAAKFEPLPTKMFALVKDELNLPLS